MISSISSLHTLFLAIVSVFVGLPSSDGVDDWYMTPFSLSFIRGNLKNIEYPLQGDGRPRYCGHPVLQPWFIDDPHGRHPYLKIGPKDLVAYDALSFDFAGYNVTPKLHGALDYNTIDYGRDLGEMLQFNKSIEQIHFNQNCNKGVVPNRSDGSVSCYESSSVHYGKYYASRTAFQAYNSAEVPDFAKRFGAYSDKVVSRSHSQVVTWRFEGNHENSLDCDKCYNSGCICESSSSSDFVCLCKPAINRLRRLIIVASASLAVGIGIFILIAWYLRNKKSSEKFATFWRSEARTCRNVDAFLQIYGSFALTRHTYKNLRKITIGFKEKLGEGGYATVYKGKLSSGRLVAVKVLKQSKGDGEDFLNEVASISRTNHVNIVTLLGFCFKGKKRALVYEYLPNGSLEKFTYHGARASNNSLPWQTLLNIATGIAKGLDYLHQGCNARILHFDIKPHNILLDQEFTPKISDFGLARLCPLKESSISIMEARGTIGYIAPEVFCRTFGGVSPKSDVYSFGMMVLDMVCGRNNLSANQQKSSDLYFPDWIYDRLELQEETSSFQGTTNDQEKALQRKMILVSLWCIQSYPSNRPSMSTVVHMLQGCLEKIQMPPRPCLSPPPRLAFNTSETITQTHH